MVATKAAKEKRHMDMPKIRKKAKELGIKQGRMSKTELIHSVQAAEGYTACFGTSNGQCGYSDCCFMQDCLKVKL